MWKDLKNETSDNSRAQGMIASCIRRRGQPRCTSYIEWDEAKNQSNIRKHGLDFTDAHEMFAGSMLTVLNTRVEYGEDRWIGIGNDPWASGCHCVY
jgi:hypothetical protein